MKSPSTQSILFFLLTPGLNAKQVKPFASIKASLDYLNEVRDPAKIVSDERCIRALIDVKDKFRQKRDQIDTIMEAKLQMILKDLIDYLYITLVAYIERDQPLDIELENTHASFTSFHLCVDLIEVSQV